MGVITAAVSTGPQTPFSIEELDLAPCGRDEVLVRLVATGVCHTDLVIKAMLPAEAGAVVLGHEGAGIVEEVGAEVSDVAVGAHVVLSFSSCGACSYCDANAPAYCANFEPLNMPGVRADGSPTLTRDGAPVLGTFFGQSSFASHVLSPARNVIVVDDDLDLVLAAPLGCGVQTGAGAVLNVLRPRADSSLVVYGTGGVGLAAVMAARAVGVGTVVAVDLVRGRRELAAALGATATLDPAGHDVVAAVTELTGGGASHALDTTGVPAVIAQAVRSLGSLGSLVVVGLGQPEVTIDVQDLIAGGKTVRGCIEGDAVAADLVPRLVEFYRQGKFPLDALVTRYSFAEINRAVADSQSGVSVKPVLVF